ncbi:MAG TPA: phosphate ABC transporter substrate-binding protein PstS [Acidothermaceae bacterium]
MNISRTAAAVLAAGGLLAVAACSDNNTPSSSAAATGGTSTSAGAQGNSSAPATTPSTGSAPTKCVSASLTGAGSSFQDPIEQKWISVYRQDCSGAQINYTSVGSGAGIQQFGSGTIDFAGSDVTMKADQQSTANARCGGNPAIHIPISAGGVGVTWNLPNLTALKFSPDTIADIFQGKLTKWNDPEIAADNPGVSLPSTAITVFHRSDASGTNSVFSSFLTATSKKWTLGSGTSLNWPTSGQGAKGNQGVSAGVAQTVGGVTYTEQAFALQHKLPLAQIKNTAGNFVELTADNVSKALAEATVTPGSANDVSAKMNYTPSDPSAYPISSLTYAIVCGKYPSSMSADKVSLIKSYLSYGVTDGQQFATQLGFSPLPPNLVAKDQAAISGIS